MFANKKIKIKELNKCKVDNRLVLTTTNQNLNTVLLALNN